MRSPSPGCERACDPRSTRPPGALPAEPRAQSKAAGTRTARRTGRPGRRRARGTAQPLTTAAPLGRPGASPSVRRARPRAAAPQPGNFWPPPQRRGGESGTRACDGERAEQGLPRKSVAPSLPAAGWLRRGSAGASRLATSERRVGGASPGPPARRRAAAAADSSAIWPPGASSGGKAGPPRAPSSHGPPVAGRGRGSSASTGNRSRGESSSPGRPGGGGSAPRAGSSGPQPEDALRGLRGAFPRDEGAAGQPESEARSERSGAARPEARRAPAACPRPTSGNLKLPLVPGNSRRAFPAPPRWSCSPEEGGPGQPLQGVVSARLQDPGLGEGNGLSVCNKRTLICADF